MSAFTIFPGQVTGECRTFLCFVKDEPGAMCITCGRSRRDHGINDDQGEFYDLGPSRPAPLRIPRPRSDE